MSNRKVVPTIALVLFISFPLIQSGQTQAKRAKYPLTQLNNEGCMAKGRVQDCSGSVRRQIFANGKNAIPVLISHLTATARTQYQIADYWRDTRPSHVTYT